LSRSIAERGDHSRLPANKVCGKRWQTLHFAARITDVNFDIPTLIVAEGFHVRAEGLVKVFPVSLENASKDPNTGIADDCARTANGNVAALLKTTTKLRLFIASPRRL